VMQGDRYRDRRGRIVSRRANGRRRCTAAT
jgi:hypothetical protein